MATCIECGDAVDEIHHHHIDYETNKTVPVCGSCHSKIHSDTKHRLHPDSLENGSRVVITARVNQSTNEGIESYADQTNKSKSRAIEDLLEAGLIATQKASEDISEISDDIDILLELSMDMAKTSSLIHQKIISRSVELEEGYEYPSSLADFNR